MQNSSVSPKNVGVNCLQPLLYSCEQIAEYLDQTPWSKDFSWQQLLILAQHTRAFTVAAGEHLFEEGSPGGSMGIVLRGSINIMRDGHCLAVLRRGRTYGEMSLIDGQVRSATAIAHEDSDLVVMDQILLERLTQQHPRVALRLVQRIAYFLSQNLRKTSGELAELLSLTQDGKSRHCDE